MSNFTPAWFKKGFFNESLFCDDFLSTHQLLYSNGAFFTPDGRMTDTMPLRCEIFEMMREYVGANLAKKVTNVVDVLKLAAQVEDFPPVTDRIALANGTLYLDGTFQEGKPEIVRNRLPVKYDPKAAQPTHWLRFLSDLLYPEDVPTVQEFIGYCLIPSNKGQRMMVIKGSGGEGKSQIGVVLSRLFGCNMKDGSIGKISENRFARADLEHTLLCVDDDMRMEALRQTNYVKSIVTAQGQMDLERKGKQSYQGWMYARLLAFSNGDLQALYDRSDGFYRRQLILTTKDKPLSRVDDPDIAEKMAAEVEGILLWAFEGLQRLVKNGFQFTESDRAKRNRELVKRDNNNVFDFLESEGYIRLKADACTSSKELYEVYKMWCEENSLNEAPLKKEIYEQIRYYATTSVARRIEHIMQAIKLACASEPPEIQTDRIHVRNGTYFVDGHFTPEKEYCMNRLPISYVPEAPAPTRWLQFLNELLYEEDIPALQEYIGYCLLPVTKAQKMLLMVGKGGEGKSRIGLILRELFGSSMYTGNLQKVETNRFARADLEYKLLLVDDDMKTEALPQTNNIKTLVTLEDKIDIERKGQQSVQGTLYVRFACFGNGSLHALYDKSNGFYRRQLLLTTKEKPVGRVDDPFLIDKMRNEKEGILLWALEGLHRLIRNNYQFTISERTTANLKEAMEQGNNILGFLKSEGYFEIRQGAKCKSTDFYKVYERWCLDNLEKPLAASTFIHHLKDNQKSLGIVYDDKCIGTNRGFHNVDVDLFLPIDVPSPWD